MGSDWPARRVPDLGHLRCTNLTNSRVERNPGDSPDSKSYEQEELQKSSTWQKTWINIFPKKIYKQPMGIWKDAEYHQRLEKCKSKTTVRYHPMLVRIDTIKWPQTTSARKDVEKGNPCILLVRRQIGTAPWKRAWRLLKKLKIGNLTTSSPNPGHISEEKESANSKRYMHPMPTAALSTTAKTWSNPNMHQQVNG